MFAQHDTHWCSNPAAWAQSLTPDMGGLICRTCSAYVYYLWPHTHILTEMLVLGRSDPFSHNMLHNFLWRPWLFPDYTITMQQRPSFCEDQTQSYTIHNFLWPDSTFSPRQLRPISQDFLFGHELAFSSLWLVCSNQWRNVVTTGLVARYYDGPP